MSESVILENGVYYKVIKTYFPDGVQESEHWSSLKQDNYGPHRENKPAIIRNFEDGTPRYCTWYNFGYRHRNCGPAHIVWNTTGNILMMRYWVNGNDISSDVYRWVRDLQIPVNEINLPDEIKVLFRLKWG